MLVLALLGCSSWIDQEPACGQDVYYWSDDVLAHILTGDGSGEFDYDPVDAPRTKISGEYEPSTGDFEWVERFDPEYYIERAEVEGFGTAYHNGDLDLLFTRTVTDVLGNVFATKYRVQRDECDMLIAAWPAENGSPDDALVQKGSYADESVWEWSVDYPGYAWQGSLRKNLARTERIESEDGSYYSYTESRPDGISEGDFVSPCDSYSCEGSEVRNFDGSVEQTYDILDGGDVVATAEASYAYDGSGTLTIEAVGGESCTYTYDDDGDCSYECSDGSDGSC